MNIKSNAAYKTTKKALGKYVKFRLPYSSTVIP
jgi:hypothetical protein